MNLRITLIGLAIFLSACDLSLASDLTPPPDALVSNQATPNPIAAPANDPDLVNGAGLYTQNCAACHGPGGLGDGEQGAQLPFAPAPLGDADFALAASPANWFRWVSEGRLTRFMPPFASLLSEQERWDVLAYVYGLSWDEDELLRGAELYTQAKLEVDGLLGGDPLLVQLGLLQPLELSDEDTSALTAYLQARALGVEVSDLQQVAVSQEPAENIDLPEVGSFTGKVIYAGENALPAGLEATLSGYDHAEQVFTTTVELDADGQFVFEDIPLAAQRIYFVQVAYQGQIYFSEFINPTGSHSEFQLPITVYETTTSTEQLAVETVQLFFDFSKPDIVRVAQQVTISNLGDRAVVPQADGTPVLYFSMPDGAANLAFEEGALGERYLQEETGFGDLRGVLPGANSYRMLFAYELPYTNSLKFSLGIDLPTRTVLALVPENQIKLNSTGFQLTTSQLVDGDTYTAYVASAGYLLGDEVPIALSGAHPAAYVVWDALLRDDSLLLGLAALTAAVGFAWLWVRSLPAPNPEQLLEEIAVLDERYAAHRISKASYAKRRATLKSQLRDVLAKRAKR